MYNAIVYNVQDIEVSCATITCHVLMVFKMASPAKRTRYNTKHAVFVNPAVFSGNVLPTRMDCCHRVLSLRDDRISVGDLKSPRQVNFLMNEVYSQVASEVIEIWHWASLTTSNPDAVAENIKKWYEQGVKFGHLSENARSRNKRFKMYEANLDKLLDICTCKCKVLHFPAREIDCSLIHHKGNCDENCNVIHLDCKCQEINVPDSEVPFLLSQRGNCDSRNLLVISSSVDKHFRPRKERGERTKKSGLQSNRRHSNLRVFHEHNWI